MFNTKYVCPKCGSDEVQYDYTVHYSKTGAINPPMKCNECKHSGLVFPEVDVDQVDEVKKDFSENKNSLPETYTDIRQGLFEWAFIKKFFWVIVVILLIVFVMSRV